MSEAARMIRRYLDEQGGSTEASVHHLLSKFEVEDDADGRAQIMSGLREADVRVEPPLVGLRAQDEVVLLSAGRPAEGTGPAPWDRPRERNDRSTTVMPATAAPPHGTGSPNHSRANGVRHAAIVALVALLAAGAGVGGYLAGKSGGEDLDAARAAGERQGKRDGAERGARRGYQEGFKKARKAGYNQTYDKAYIRAYVKEFEEAGLAVPEDVNVP